MTSFPFILVYGRDPTLLVTRSWVLEAAGFRVRTAEDFAAIQRTVSATPVDLLILCHSLSPQETNKALAAARAAKPRMKILSITSNTPVSHTGRQEPTVSMFDGPRALIDAVVRSLAEG